MRDGDTLSIGGVLLEVAITRPAHTGQAWGGPEPKVEGSATGAVMVQTYSPAGTEQADGDDSSDAGAGPRALWSERQSQYNARDAQLLALRSQRAQQREAAVREGNSYIRGSFSKIGEHGVAQLHGRPQPNPNCRRRRSPLGTRPPYQVPGTAVIMSSRQSRQPANRLTVIIPLAAPTAQSMCYRQHHQD